MKIDKDGKVNSFDLASLRIMDEFSFDVEAMSDEIISLRDQLVVAGKELERANEAVSNQG